MNRFAFIFWALSLLATLSGCSMGSSGENAFELELTLISDEISEDSNMVTETLIIEGNSVEYSWVYDGYHPSDDFDRENSFDFELSSEQSASLVLYLEDKGLTQDLEEVQPAQDMGNLVTLDLTVTEGGESHVIHIKGMSDIWGVGQSGGNIVNMATVEAAQDFITTVKDLGGFYED